MFIKIPLFQPVSPSGAQVPIANSNKAPAGTFHLLVETSSFLSQIKSIQVLLPSSICYLIAFISLYLHSLA